MDAALRVFFVNKKFMKKEGNDNENIRKIKETG